MTKDLDFYHDKGDIPAGIKKILNKKKFLYQYLWK